MANRFFSPNQQFADNTGLPYAGGTLAFYASGTSTPLATYSNQALTIPNTNPVTLDSAGRAGDIFLQNLAYKVVLSQLNSDGSFTQVWTDDPVYSSDFSTVAAVQSGAGSPNGVVAGTQGSTTIPASMYWDTTNNILYVCTTTGTTSTAAWTAVNASTAAAVVPAPQGRLTLTSGVPVISTDTIGATAIIYTPYNGNIVPIYNGSSLIPTVFTELTLTLASQHVASTLYDIFIFNNSGVATLVTGPAWSSSAAGSSSRGTGAGTTQISKVNGLSLNTVQISGRNGATTYTIGANLATYLGTILINATPGQVSCTVTAGQSRVWGVWNAFNRSPCVLNVSDPASSFGGTGSVAPTNSNTGDRSLIICGLAEEIVTNDYIQDASTTSPGDSGNFGIGWNVTNAYSGLSGTIGTGTTLTLGGFSAKYEAPPFLGLSFAQSCCNATGLNLSFLGGSSRMLMTSKWRS